MNVNRKQLVLKQLDTTLAGFAKLKMVTPPKGWIRAIRESLGMSGRQFAARLGVSPPRVTALERDELVGKLSIKSMRRAAEALDCVFVYALVPRESLEATVRAQAEKVVRERLAYTSHSMLLEDQHLIKEEEVSYASEVVEEMIRTLPSTLWNDDGF